MLTDKHIEQFRTLYKNRFGEELSRDEAYERGTQLITLVKAIYKPIKKSQNEEN